ncbi:MAG: hypothetical protein V2I36_03400 [Desulfopila sp.]|jgi:hypothetical protein|nr:hypothetical protein [Desulfopila sp.]
MAAGKRKQVKKYRFELTRTSIGGIGIVCFCIFLWMFLLGVWAGQSLLSQSYIDPIADGGESLQQIVNLTEQKKQKPQ